MQYVNFGRSGLGVSRICLGMLSYGARGWRDWTLTEDQARPIVRRAAELGNTFYDTAEPYADGISEEITGRLLKEIFPRCDEYVVATKVGHLDDAVAAVDLQLSPQDVALLEEPYRPKRVLGM